MLKVVNAPKEAKLSELYNVEVCQGGEWLPLSVYVALTPDGVGNGLNLSEEAYAEFDGLPYGTIAVKTYVASFSFDGEVKIRVRYNGDVESFRIKPRNSVSFTQNENVIEFTVNKPSKFCIEPDGDDYGALHLFCEAPEIFDKESYDNVIYFEKGYYTAENCEHIKYNEHGFPVLKVCNDNTLIFAEQGAVVCAVLEIVSCKHVKVAGLGMFSNVDRFFGADKNFDIPVIHGGFRNNALPQIYVHAGCDDIVLQDVTLICEFRGIGVRNASKITLNNLKTFSWAVNGDGINFINVIDAEVKNCYVHSSDDSFALFTSCDSILTLQDPPELTRKPRTANISLHDCLLWTNARVFMIGGHSTGAKDPHDVIENIRMYDCEVLGDASNVKGKPYNHRLYWSGIFRVLSQTEGLIKDIFFENITVNWTKGYTGKPFHIEVRGNDASYTEKSGYRIENVSFKDIRFFDVPEDYVQSYIKSVEYDDPNYCVTDISFENVTLDGVPFDGESIIKKGRVENIKA